MIPHTYPNNLNPFSDMSQCVITYLSSVSGMTAWTDYIPVRTVSATGNIEGRTEATGYQAVYVLTVLTNKTAWIDYIPVYEDGTKTVAWSTDANGYIPIGISEAGAEQILSEADFQADLTHSLVLDAGTGSPTFTRATTATFTDFEGVLRTVPAGCARFVGARFVRNILPATEDFSGWSTSGSNKAVYNTSPMPSDVTNGLLQTNTAAGSVSHQVYRIGQTITAGVHIAQARFKKYAAQPCKFVMLNAYDGSGHYVWFNVQGAVPTVATQDAGSIGAVTDDGDGWYLLSHKRTLAASANGGMSLEMSETDGAAGTTMAVGDGAIWAGPQLEDITGRTDQTTPSEYVSVGVLSAPYHGAGVDGVEFFDTDLDGNALTTLETLLTEPAATNVCLQSNAFTTTWAGTAAAVQNASGPDGATSAWTVTDSSAVVFQAVSQAGITLTAAPYTYSLFIKKTSGATAFPVLQLYSGTAFALCTCDTNNGVVTAWTSNGYGSTLVGVSARCSDFNDVFWRFELTATATAAAYIVVAYPAATANASQSSGTLDATLQGSAVFYGAQVELGSSATSYIPTTTVAVARNADVPTYTGGDIASLKTLAATFRREAGVSNVGVIASVYSDATHYIEPFLNSATEARFIGQDGTVQWNTAASNAYTPGTQSKMAQTWVTNDIKMDKDGTAQTPDTSATIPVVSSIGVGHAAGSYQLNGHVGHIYGWTTNKSQSELGAIDR